MRRLFFGASLMLALSLGAQTTVAPGTTGYFSFAQRISNQGLVGSARTLGFGGAQMAIGGDNTSSAINPGGLALYRKSDWSFTLRSNSNNYVSDYASTVETRTTRSNFAKTTIPNVSFVFSDVDDSPESDWKAQTFSMSVIRLEDYNSEYTYAGSNRERSFRNYLVEEANGIDYVDLESGLDGEGYVFDRLSAAYIGWLIHPIANNGTADERSTYFTLDNSAVDEVSEIVSEFGGKTAWNFAYAGNYKDQLYVGINAGLEVLRWGSERIYTESPSDQTNADIQSLVYEEDVLSRGNAFSLSLGGIYKVDDNLRLGLSYKLPTTMRVKEVFSEELTINYNNVDASTIVPNFPAGSKILTVESFGTKNYEFKYDVKMPSRTSVGAAYFFEKKGFVSMDIDYTPMHQMDLSSDEFNFIGDNQTISNVYKGKVDIRVGAERRFDNILVRGGYQRQGNPYVKDFEVTSLARNVYTTGLGYRGNEFYADLAIIHERRKLAHSPYSFENGGELVVYTGVKSTGWMATFGLLF